MAKLHWRTFSRIKGNAKQDCEICGGTGFDSKLFHIKTGNPVSFDFPCECTCKDPKKSGGATIEGSLKAIKDILAKTGPKDIYRG